jgi:hypothetical protein
LKQENQFHSPFKNDLKFSTSADVGYHSDCSDSKSISEDNYKYMNHLQGNGAHLCNEDDLTYQLYYNRVMMSMKRNILKKNLSEDLTWANYFKNEIYNQNI